MRSFHRHLIATAIVSFAAAIGLFGAALAQELKKPADGFPSRQVIVIVPFGPGGGGDIMARAWSQAMEKVVGVPFIVVNQPGGGGYAALPDYMSRPHDGYAILAQDDTIVPGELLGQTNVRVFEKLEPICATNVAPAQLYIRTDEKRFTDWPSFLSYAKAHPGKVIVANFGFEVIQVGMLEEAAGFKVKQLQFDKPAERYGSILGGHTDLIFEKPGSVIAFLQSKQLKPILSFIQGPRMQAFPEAPTLSELGYSSVTAMPLTRMLFIHKDAPEERKSYFKRGCEIAYKSEIFQDHLAKRHLNLAPSYLSSTEATEELKATSEVYRAYFKKTGQIK